MKAIVVYFSFEGNTKLIAEAVTKTISSDSVELKTSKKYPTQGLSKFFWGGKSVMFGEKPELLNELIDLDQYDTILIGTPVWASSFAPPIKSFIDQYKIKGRKIGLFACHGGGGSKKCFEKFKKALDGNAFIGEVDFYEPKKKPEESTQKAVEWARKISGPAS
ncbi:flavodoxin [Clostridium sp. E02]|uniref:flavodoxin family protein n=1 Tax=Clostridium sp. E02 TaxID=2487134 RepID=UPI000F548283|nr:flavodoxin [Clostridium sp. E02]